MRFKHPFSWIEDSAALRTFAATAILALVLMTVLQILGKPLVTEAAPAGIVSFELAGDLPTAESILNSWLPGAGVYAGLNLGIDFLFLFAYSLAIGLACALLANRFAGCCPRFALSGYVLSWGLLLAGALDAIENIALVTLMTGSRWDIWPTLALWAAIPKFLLVLLGLLYSLAGFLTYLVRKPV